MPIICNLPWRRGCWHFIIPIQVDITILRDEVRKRIVEDDLLSTIFDDPEDTAEDSEVNYFLNSLSEEELERFNKVDIDTGYNENDKDDKLSFFRYMPPKQ